MIDIHSHILSGIDDGAKELDDSLDLARMAVQEGIHTIIATPHHKNGRYENAKPVILQRVKELNQVLEQENIPLTVLPGQEPRIYGDIIPDYENGEILTLNDGDQYLFIELPSNHVPRYTEQLLFDIQMKGLTPIIVHPERNQELMEQPDTLYQLVKKGALTQITAASVAGFFGKNIKKFSLQLIDANLTHFVSSDAHNISSRSFKMVEALDVIEKKYGVDMIYLFKENADLLVQGKNVNKEIPIRLKTKKFLGIF
ncbi:tyrosine-protein phosphatase [Robertmurraya andreesenii]|uniref:Tyrosine-protein phosphatase n=1 Tax=Anoxybacillus andreesenii TaxID=1325932 RepID=A0ABT9UZT4_9BACL|nr:CpsB/CapC family capsule biosynthesis tyrosine phosphatase [Robertmurraya andreesenii]MDQ0154201.1 protein-tyrosine phosphatase [Robertmurraya andreesenii]